MQIQTLGKQIQGAKAVFKRYSFGEFIKIFRVHAENQKPTTFVWENNTYKTSENNSYM